MVLGEFSEDKKEELFSNKKVRGYLIDGIKRKDFFRKWRSYY